MMQGDVLVNQVLKQEDFTEEEKKAFAQWLRGPLGLKMLAHLLTMEDSAKDAIARCDFTKPEGVSLAVKAQGGQQALRQVFDLLVDIKPTVMEKQDE